MGSHLGEEILDLVEMRFLLDEKQPNDPTAIRDPRLLNWFKLKIKVVYDR